MPDDHLWTLIFISVLTTLLCALCSVSYYAVINGVESRIRKSAEDGDRRAQKLLSAMENADRATRDLLFAVFITAALGCVSFVAAILPALYSSFKFFTSVPVLFLSAAALTAFYIIIVYVFAVMIPRRASEHNAVAAYTATAWISRPLALCCRPAAVFSSFTARGILGLFGVNADAAENVTTDEILDMIDAGEESGNIESTEKEMIENVFEFSDISASDVMTHRTDMEAVNLSESDEDIEKIIKESGFSRFPVYDDDIDNIVGVLYTREYLINAMSDTPKPLSDLIHEPMFVPEQVRADVLFREMQKKKQHMAVVLDEYGGTSGLVTMEDLLEEIFGNIYDEFDEKEPPEIQKLSDNAWRVSGSVDLDTLADSIGIEFDDEVYEEYDTLGGLVFSCLSLIPGDGERPHVQAFGLDIQVEVVADRRVEWAIVSILSDPDDTAQQSDDDNAAVGSKD